MQRLINRLFFIICNIYFILVLLQLYVNNVISIINLILGIGIIVFIIVEYTNKIE